MKKFISNKYKLDKATGKITANFLEDCLKLVDEYVITLRKLSDEESREYGPQNRSNGISDDDLFDNIQVYLNEAKDYIHYCLNRHMNSKKILFLQKCKDKRQFQEHLNRIQKKWRKKTSPNLLGTNYSPLYVDFTKTPKQAVRDIIEGKDPITAKHEKSWTYSSRNVKYPDDLERHKSVHLRSINKIELQGKKAIMGGNEGGRSKSSGKKSGNLTQRENKPPTLFSKSKAIKKNSRPKNWIDGQSNNASQRQSKSLLPRNENEGYGNKTGSNSRKKIQSKKSKRPSKNPKNKKNSKNQQGDDDDDDEEDEDYWLPRAHANDNVLIDEEPLFIPKLIVDNLKVPAFTVDRYNPEIQGKLFLI